MNYYFFVIFLVMSALNIFKYAIDYFSHLIYLSPNINAFVIMLNRDLSFVSMPDFYVNSLVFLRDIYNSLTY